MNEVLAISWSDVLTMEFARSAIRIIVLLFVGFPLILSFAALVGRSTRKRLTPQANMLIRKGIVYFGSIVIFIAVLNQSGYKLTALLGAAGIVGIAIGFAIIMTNKWSKPYSFFRNFVKILLFCLLRAFRELLSAY